MNKNTDEFRQLSAAISWMRFPLIFLIIMLHAYSVATLPGNDHRAYFGTVYPFALWLGETGVPGFFFISGFLFFVSSKGYGVKLQTRVHTLLVPYLLWNGLLVALYVGFLLAGHPQEILGRSMQDYTLVDYLRLFWDRGSSWDSGNFVPLLCPFWYIRNLLVACLLSPLFYACIKYGREAFLLAATLWWLATPNNAFVQQTVLFFCWGGYYAVRSVSPLSVARRHRVAVVATCVLLGVADYAVHTLWPTPFNLQVHRLALMANIPALLLVADWCMGHGVHHPLLTQTAFIVFSVHYPVVVALRKLALARLGHADDAVQVLLYVGCIVLTTAVSLAAFWLLNRYCPKLCRVLSGNR